MTIRLLEVNRIHKRIWLAAVVFAVVCFGFVGLVQATGLTPYFNATTTTTTTTMYGATVFWETYNSSDNTALNSNYTVYYKLSTAAGYTTLCSSATEASGLKNCSVSGLYRSKAYNCNVTACNGTSCNTSVSTFYTTAYDNVNSTMSTGAAVTLSLQGGMQFISHTFDSMLDTSQGLSELIVIFLIAGLALGLVAYFAVAKKKLM